MRKPVYAEVYKKEGMYHIFYRHPESHGLLAESPPHGYGSVDEARAMAMFMGADPIYVGANPHRYPV